MSVEPGKWGVIYNPKAGTRKVQKRWKEIKEYMDSKECHTTMCSPKVSVQ